MEKNGGNFLKNHQPDKLHQRTLNLSVFLLLIFVNNPLLAQFMPESTLGDSDSFSLPPPPPQYSEESAPVLPPLPKLPPIDMDGAGISSQGSINVKGFQFKGNMTCLEIEQLEGITQRYVDKEITAEQLQEIKNKITEQYIKEGCINSGAIIPDQPVEDGIITINLIEGQLVQVNVLNSEELRLRSSYIENRLKGESGDTLDIEKLQERLQLLQQNPRIKRLEAELGPGVKLGEGILNLKIYEDDPYQFQFRFNNYRSPSIGAYRGQMEYWHRNVTGSLFKQHGLGDTFYFRYGLTEGLNDFGVRYDLPINDQDTTLSFLFERSDSEVIEYPFSLLDVESEADTYAILLSHPWIKRSNESLDLTLRLEKRASKTFLLGRPFSFSPGVENGESKLSVIRFSQDYVHRNNNRVIAGRSSFNFGMDALNSTINDDGSPDSEFFSWLGQFQIAQRLSDLFDSQNMKKSQIIFRADLQWANQDLLPIEKLSIGGATTVRGYRENVLTRDNGFISSLEWRIPVWKMPLWSDNEDDGRIEIAPFFDYGHSWNADSDTPEPKDIYSAGVGLRWSPNKNIHANLYWGYALQQDDIPEPDEKDLQDDGVHFELSIQYPFK